MQCESNNVKHDPNLSAAIARPGIDYVLGKGYKKPAAMFLHNIGAFFMPNFDEGVSTADAQVAVEAARQQVPLRKEIGDEGPLMWAYWDLGCAELAAGNFQESLEAFKEGEKLAGTQEGTGGAWCRIFTGKIKIKYMPELKEQGVAEMLAAARELSENGADWEKESAEQILSTAGLKL